MATATGHKYTNITFRNLCYTTSNTQHIPSSLNILILCTPLHIMIVIQAFSICTYLLHIFLFCLHAYLCLITLQGMLPRSYRCSFTDYSLILLFMIIDQTWLPLKTFLFFRKCATLVWTHFYATLSDQQAIAFVIVIPYVVPKNNFGFNSDAKNEDLHCQRPLSGSLHFIVIIDFYYVRFNTYYHHHCIICAYLVSISSPTIITSQHFIALLARAAVHFCLFTY